MAVLALDLGGTKLAAALVDGASVLTRQEVATDRAGGAAAWMAAIGDLVRGWKYDCAGMAVTGLVRDGLWRALNPGTLPVPDDFPLLGALRASLGVPLIARNDAQAAAWGEYRFGGVDGPTMLFVTVSTGIGGGLVLDGRLVTGRSGLTGHLGIAPVDTEAGVKLLEDVASGSALARLADRRATPREVTAAAARGEPWAETLLDAVLAPMALSLRRLQLELDPDCVVIGGGLGLAPGYLDRLGRHLAPVPAMMRPCLRAAALGADAGLIGIADLALHDLTEAHA